MTATVRSIMQADVLTVDPDTTIKALVRLLSDNGVSGVPVVDEQDVLVGVVSMTDVIRLAAEEGGGAYDASDDFFLPEWTSRKGPSWDALPLNESFDDVRVGDIMTPVAFTVPPTATVTELADFLLRGHIHRAVVEEGGRLLGIVTTFDVLKVVASLGPAPVALAPPD